jgi:hypothetical protein
MQPLLLLLLPNLYARTQEMDMLVLEVLPAAALQQLQ